MALLTQMTWVWVSSGSWWWTGTPGKLQPMRLQRVGHDWATELNWEIYTATVSLSVHQRNRTNRIYQSTHISIYRYRDTEGDSLGRTRLHDYGGRVLQSDICKLEPHETWKTKNQGANGTNLCPKAQEVGILISESKRKISQLQAEIKFAHSPPFFFSIQTPTGLEDAYLHWWGMIFSLLIQMPISSRNNFTDTPRNDTLPVIWTSFSPVKLTQKI